MPMGANGKKVEIDPETFKISNGKLYYLPQLGK